jgi:glucokinase
MPKEKAPGKLIFQEEYPNLLFKTFTKIVEVFLEHADDEYESKLPRPTIGVLAIAGVVNSNKCRYTNLDWVVNGDELAEHLGIGRIEIINDFLAQGYGVLTLADNEVDTLHDAPVRFGAPIVCIGAGTGLGTTFLTCGPRGHYKAFPSEGGHSDFPPRDHGSHDVQLELLKFLKIKVSGYTRVSVERVVSGKGILNVYEFLAYKYPEKTDEHVHQLFSVNPTDAGIIAGNAWPGSLCEEALKIFANCYGSYVGSVALMLMPFGGIYLSGGVTLKLKDWLQRDGSFMKSYMDKGRVSALLNDVPLFFVKTEDLGQRGAHLRAVRVLHEHLEGDAVGFRKSDPDNSGLAPPRELDPAIAQVARLITEYQKKRGHQK